MLWLVYAHACGRLTTVADTSYLDWPFFDPTHRDHAARFDAWVSGTLRAIDHGDVEGACRRLVSTLGADGWLTFTAPAPDDPAARLDVRTLALSRERLARHDGLADFAFAMQGLGIAPVSLFGSAEQRQRWLPRTRTGRATPAFALTETAAGSDVAAIATTARRDGDAWVLDGEKTWISNGAHADVYVVFARTGEAPGAKGLSAFVIPSDTPGLAVVERLHTIAPHPLARIRFERCRVPGGALLGAAGDGFRIAMATLDVFRATVGAAALGFARRALDESVQTCRERQRFGAPLSHLQLVQGHLADMALDIDTAALLVYRAAWLKDTGAARISREAAMAKLHATEAAQRVIDTAVQLHGGEGVRSGHVVERLYREIRALRIYEGASDVQRVVIARSVLAEGGAA
jgi:acyl-CoA dehydrogenase